MATSPFSGSPLSALGLTPQVWARLSPLLDACLEQPEAERAAWIAALPAEQADLKPRLQQLTGAAPAALLLPSLDEPDDDEPWRSGDTVGPWRLLQPLGRGGMGTVWLARRADGLLQRPVALKLPRVDALGLTRRGLAERMARERDVLAALSHPHIAQLHDAGVTDQGQPYLALEWVQGEPIDAWCRARQLDTQQRVRLFLQVAQAVIHAHAKLIVHRDLKPSNLLVDADGHVKLLDFGIAKLLEPGAAADSTLTRDHARPMTPDYASPEQLVGGEVDTRSDVYALGVLLYELLTGERPYRLLQRTLPALVHAVLHEEPLRPSQCVTDAALRKRLRGDLDTIVLKALKKAPEERYATAMALADDLQRHLDRRPVLARPDNVGYVLRRLVARHRAAAAATTLALLAVLAAAAAAGWQAHRAERERLRAQEVKGFLTRLLHDASPWHPAAASWRTNRAVVQAMRALSAADSASDAKGSSAGPVSALDLLRQAGRHLDREDSNDAAVRAELQRVIGEGLIGFGAVREGSRRLQRALADAKLALGDEHPQVLRLRLAQVQVARLTARADEAEASLSDLLPPLREQARSGELQALEPLAVALQLATLQALDADAQGRQFQQENERRAFHLADEADAVARRLPAGHLERMRNAVLQSAVRRQQGHTAAARDAAQAALTALREADGSPMAAAALRGEALVALARAERAAGALPAALAAYDAAADEAERMLGSDSALPGLLLNGAVTVALELGQTAEARQRAQRAAQPRRSGFGADLADAAEGAVRLAEGRAEAALPLLESSLAALLRVLGPQHELSILTQARRLTALHQQQLADRARAADEGWPAVLGSGPERERLRTQLATVRAALQASR